MQFLVQQLQRKIPQELQHVFDWIIRLSSSWLVKSTEGFVKSYFTSELIESNLVSHKEPNTNNRRNICTNFERNFYFLKIENSKILICPYITIRSIYRSGKFRHAPRFIIFQKGLSELQEFFSTTWPFIIMNITLMLFCWFFFFGVVSFASNHSSIELRLRGSHRFLKFYKTILIVLKNVLCFIWQMKNSQAKDRSSH